MRVERPARWCPECASARPTTIEFARQRNDDGTRQAISAVCDQGHSFDPYS